MESPKINISFENGITVEIESGNKFLRVIWKEDSKPVMEYKTKVNRKSGIEEIVRKHHINTIKALLKAIYRRHAMIEKPVNKSELYRSFQRITGKELDEILIWLEELGIIEYYKEKGIGSKKRQVIVPNVPFDVALEKAEEEWNRIYSHLLKNFTPTQ